MAGRTALQARQRYPPPAHGLIAHTPHAAGKGDEHAEGTRVVRGARAGVQAGEDGDHDGEDDDLAHRTDCEGDIRDAVSLVENLKTKASLLVSSRPSSPHLSLFFWGNTI